MTLPRIRRSRHSRSGARAFLIFVSAISLCADLPAVHIRNFDKVSDHIYRGGEPTAVGLEELGAMGVKTILDLRQPSGATNLEKKEAEELKLKYVNVPLAELHAPSNAEIKKILALLDSDSSGEIYVHCRRGKDRTGTVIACYRIQHDGWENLRALQEAQQHGMSSFERGMRSYILHFTALSIGQGQFFPTRP